MTRSKAAQHAIFPSMWVAILNSINFRGGGRVHAQLACIETKDAIICEMSVSTMPIQWNTTLLLLNYSTFEEAVNTVKY